MKTKKAYLPIVITVSNKTAELIRNFEILNLSKDLENKNKDIEIELDSFDFTYKELVAYLKDSNIEINATHIHTNYTTQFYCLIQHECSKGKETFVPDLDAEGYRSMNYKHDGFELEKKSIIRLNKLYANSNFTLYLT
ncbi:MAG: hypothetical protein ACI9AT_000415 [Ulvibacter sp.]|jgi:hypothetical protein